VTKPTTKRKRKESDTSDRPAKKSKHETQTLVSVEIPRKASPSDRDSQCPAHSAETELPAPPLSQSDSSEGTRHPEGAPSTPHRRRTWKQTMFDNPLAMLFSPKTPPYLLPHRSFKPPPPNQLAGLLSPNTPSWSPIRKSFKPPAPGPPVPQTPCQPLWSPLNTPSRRKREIHVRPDPDAEIQEGGEDSGASELKEIVLEQTLVKKKTRQPLSDSISNGKRVATWTTARKNRDEDDISMPPRHNDRR
jgi:hypothetical protein